VRADGLLLSKHATENVAQAYVDDLQGCMLIKLMMKNLKNPFATCTDEGEAHRYHVHIVCSMQKIGCQPLAQRRRPSLNTMVAVAKAVSAASRYVALARWVLQCPLESWQLHIPQGMSFAKRTSDILAEPLDRVKPQAYVGGASHVLRRIAVLTMFTVARNRSSTQAADVMAPQRNPWNVTSRVVMLATSAPNPDDRTWTPADVSWPSRMRLNNPIWASTNSNTRVSLPVVALITTLPLSGLTPL
jgi:hypothetical protein